MLTETRSNARVTTDERACAEDERSCSDFAGSHALLIMVRMKHRGATQPHGFTLVELLVAIAIAAILAAIALPVYTEAIRKSRRAEAIALLTGLQQAQERYRANNPTYATSMSQIVPAPTTSGEHYQVTITDANATSYTLTATASNPPQSDDATCRVMRLIMATGGVLTYGSGSGETAMSGTSNPCWSR